MSLEHSPARQKRQARRLFQDDQLYTAKEVAAKLKVHLITVWKWVRSGRLSKPVKIGPATSRFPGADLNNKLFGGTTMTPDHDNTSWPAASPP
jgi:predicted DNA-binding transcriptional regulator AlpA